MFERLFRLVLLIIVAAILVYSGLWFRATDMAKEFVVETGDRYQKFSLGSTEYGNIKVAGFPFHPRLEVRDVQVTFKGGITTAEESQPYLTFFIPILVVETNIMGDKYVFRPMGIIHANNINNQTAEIKLDAPVALVKLKAGSLSAFMNGELTPQSYHYEDKGLEMVEVGGEKIISSPGTSLTVTHNFDQEGFHTQTDVLSTIAMEAGEGLKHFLGKEKTWEKFALTLNASGKQSATDRQEENIEYEYIFNDATLTIDDVDVTFQGKIKGDAAMLYGSDSEVDATIKVTNYPQLLEYMVHSGWADEKNKAALAKLIPDIANEMDEKHLTLTLLHTTGEEVFHIGKLSADEALTKFNGYGGHAVVAPQQMPVPEQEKVR